jgi:periplasmic divalent cation tolerance protein
VSGEVVVILSTAGSAEEAGRIARGLVERRLAACVNCVSGVRSVYRWEGKLCDEGEWMLVIKTRRKLAGSVVEAIRELHSYECPEAVVLPVQGGNPAYLKWVADETSL